MQSQYVVYPSFFILYPFLNIFLHSFFFFNVVNFVSFSKRHWGTEEQARIFKLFAQANNRTSKVCRRGDRGRGERRRTGKEGEERGGMNKSESGYKCDVITLIYLSSSPSYRNTGSGLGLSISSRCYFSSPSSLFSLLFFLSSFFLLFYYHPFPPPLFFPFLPSFFFIIIFDSLHICTARLYWNKSHKEVPPSPCGYTANASWSLPSPILLGAPLSFPGLCFSRNHRSQ